MFSSPLRDIARRIGDGALHHKEIAQKIIDNRRSNNHYAHIYQTFDEEIIWRQSATRAENSVGHALNGVPVSVKDAFGVTGFPTYGGGKNKLPLNWARDTGIVKRLRDCGVLFTGKTQMVEFALGGLGQNPHWGAPVNPWDTKTERVCGGSSCGAGVSLWDGTAMVALAADIAGSVRVPASMSGVVGFRPTKGMWPFGASYLGICSSLDSPGILTLSVDDAKFFVEALGRTGDDRALLSQRSMNALADVKIGFSKALFEKAQTDIADVAWGALERLSAAGAELTEVSFPEFSEAYDFYFESMIGAVECAAFTDIHFSGADIIKDPLISGRLEPARKIRATAYLKSLGRRTQLIDAARCSMEAFDVLVTPTLPISPPRFEEIEDPASYATINKSISLMTNPVNVLDLSSITMPVGKDALGLPVGLQFVGRAGADLDLLSVAQEAERVLGKAMDILGMPPRFARR